ncbi:MAG: hypothetical protein J0L99_20290 [Chitinophagales bacterium]|nr:hypothetical protein [Chitinophagales bacterium]
MRNLLILLLALICSQINAQPQAGTMASAAGSSSTLFSFDPQTTPVAVKSGDQVQLFISEYLLIQSLSARLGEASKVQKVERIQLNGVHYLAYDWLYLFNPQKTYSTLVPLVPNGNYFFAANSGTTCETSGCDQCKRDDCTCTTGIGNTCGGGSMAIPFPLLKISKPAE